MSVEGPPPRADQERSRRAERDDRNERAIEVAQLTVAVPRDAVAPVAVVVEAPAAEADVVVVFERCSDRGALRMRRWRAHSEEA